MRTLALMRFLGRLVVLPLCVPGILLAQETAPPVAPPIEVRSTSFEPAMREDAKAQPRARASELAGESALEARATAGPVSSWIEAAEGTDEIVVSPAGWAANILVNDLVAQGTGAFHLANPDASDHSFELSPKITVASGVKLFFQSHLGWATTGQTARVQVRPEGGSWTDAWTLTGTGNRLQNAYSLETVDLAAFVGETISIRFLFDNTTGSYYPQLDSSVGWLIDNIQIGTSLQTETYSDFGDPTPREILLLEYVNRARADAVAEATRLRNTTDPDVTSALSYFNVDLDLMEAQFAALTRTVQPLAMNARLMAAARLHSQDMFNNAFQSHGSSSDPVTPNQPGDGPGNRITRQSYNWFTYGENIYAFADSVWHAHAGFNVDWGSEVQGDPDAVIGGMQNPAGHRNSNHSATFREIGIGIVEGTNTVQGRSVGPLVVTQDFGVEQGADAPFLCGVTYTDNDADDFYSLGEGLGDVSITVEGALYSATSSTNGAYAIPLPGDGNYTATFHREGFAPQTVAFSVSGSANVKIDYLAVEAASPVTLLEFGTPSANTIRLKVAYAGDAGDLELRASENLTNWSALAATVTLIGGGEFQIEASRNAETVFLQVVPIP